MAGSRGCDGRDCEGLTVQSFLCSTHRVRPKHGTHKSSINQSKVCKRSKHWLRHPRINTHRFHGFVFAKCRVDHIQKVDQLPLFTSMLFALRFVSDVSALWFCLLEAKLLCEDLEFFVTLSISLELDVQKSFSVWLSPLLCEVRFLMVWLAGSESEDLLQLPKQALCCCKREERQKCTKNNWLFVRTDYCEKT